MTREARADIAPDHDVPGRGLLLPRGHEHGADGDMGERDRDGAEGEHRPEIEGDELLRRDEGAIRGRGGNAEIDEEELATLTDNARVVRSDPRRGKQRHRCRGRCFERDLILAEGGGHCGRHVSTCVVEIRLGALASREAAEAPAPLPCLSRTYTSARRRKQPIEPVRACPAKGGDVKICRRHRETQGSREASKKRSRTALSGAGS